MSLDGILHVSIVPHAFNAATFLNYIDGLLDEMNPWPGKNSVLVLDNCGIHKAPEVREMIENR